MPSTHTSPSLHPCWEEPSVSSQESLHHCFHLTRQLGPLPLLQRGLDRDEARRWLKAVAAGGCWQVCPSSWWEPRRVQVLSRAGGCLAAHHRDLFGLCSWQLLSPLLAAVKPPPPLFPGHSPVPAALQQQSSWLKHCGSSAVTGKLGSGQGSAGKTSPEGAARSERGGFHSSTSRVGEGAPQLLHYVFQAHADFLRFGFHLICSGKEGRWV